MEENQLEFDWRPFFPNKMSEEPSIKTFKYGVFKRTDMHRVIKDI